MKITKIGHCCLIIEEKGVRIMTDPGVYSTGQGTEKSIDAVLITHEHADHFHVESLKQVLWNNPGVRVITNTSVGTLLAKEGIDYEILEDRGSLSVGAVEIQGHGSVHAEIYATLPRVQNTGYFIGDTLYYPGDALHVIQKAVKILALPVAGPWLKSSEAVRFALEMKPKICIPVHDGFFADDSGPFHYVPEKVLQAEGIEFRRLKAGESTEI